MQRQQVTYTKKDRFIFLSILALIYAVAWHLQDNLCLNWDVSQLLHAVRLMLAGGSYSKDFFMPNPPMILFIYTPPVVISHYLGIKVMIPFRIYIFLISTISLFMCSVLARKLFFERDKFVCNLFLYTLASLFLILPLYSFGQRDLLLFMMIMPYVLLVTLRIQNVNINRYFAIGIGLLAGFGVTIKPQFIALPMIIEAYYFFHKRHFLCWCRVETITILTLYVVYAFIVLTYFNNYLFVIIPFIVQNYYNIIGCGLSRLISDPTILFSSIAFLLYAQCYKNSPYKILSTSLLLTLAGFLVNFFSQHNLCIYHILPIYFATILLLVLLFGTLASNQVNLDKYDYLSIGIVSITALAFLINFIHPIGDLFLPYPIVFFAFFFFFLLILLSLFASTKRKTIHEQIFIASLGLLIFSYPVFLSLNLYSVGTSYKQQVLNNLIAFMKTQPPHQSIYVFSIDGNYNAPLMDYIDTKSVGRFDCLWMLGGLINQMNVIGDKNLRQFIKANHSPDFFLNMITEDIEQQKPNLVFVDVRTLTVFNKGLFYPFDILNYFSENARFLQAWQHYHYLTTLSGEDSYGYKLAVYKRI